MLGIRNSALENPNKKKEEGTEKLVNALKKLDGYLAKFGLQHYQERLHLIAKTIRSIEAHADCYVSDFTLDENIEVPLEKLYQDHLNYQSEYLTVKTDGKVEFPTADSKDNFTCEFTDLLSFMEDELKVEKAVNNLKLNEESSDEGDEGETEDKSNNTSTNEVKLNSNSKIKSLTKKNTDPQAEMRKKFFNIEIKLRAFIKQQQQNDLIKGENFESFVNQLKLKTPVKNVVRPNPSFIKNFFAESKIDMDNIKKKRMTMMNDVNIKKLIGDINKEKPKKNMVKSEMIKVFATGGQNMNKKVSDFSVDPITEDQLEMISGKTNKRDSLRNSIFRSPYMFDPENGELMNDDNLDDIEPLTKEEVGSVISDTDEDEDEESEYEEIEEEVEEEVEVEELVEVTEDLKVTDPQEEASKSKPQ